MVAIDDEKGGNWLETDAAKDVVGSVRHALRCAQSAQEDAQEYKWLLLALHSALQGGCVCHLTTIAEPIGAVGAKNAEEWLRYYNGAGTNPVARPPRTQLMNLPDLLKTVRLSNSSQAYRGEPIEISDEELEWLIRFHRDFRNQFTHFEPRGWVIDLSGVTALARLIARIVTDILDRGWAFRHLDVKDSESLRGALLQLASISVTVPRD